LVAELFVPKRLLGPLSVAVVCVILTLGLWPFHTVMNDVRWSRDTPGVTFDGEGTLFTEPAFPAGGPRYSIEVWASAEDLRGQSTLLTFFNPSSGDCPQVSLVRAWGDLKLETRQEKSYFQIIKHKTVFDDVFQPGELVFITITSGIEGTTVYRNGDRVRTRPEVRVLDCAFQGRLIVGDASGRSDGWAGKIRGIATYQSELREDQVRRHARTWIASGQPLIEEQDQAQALYLFNEGSGARVFDQRGNAPSLERPERYTVVDKKILSGFWDAFSLSPGYWLDFFNNVIGFVPVGFMFFAYLANATSTRRPALLAFLLGVAVSLVIECTQPFLATRESDMTDLMTNSLGTWIGVVLSRWLAEKWQQLLGRSLFH
jgi:hypothetical protein